MFSSPNAMLDAEPSRASSTATVVRSFLFDRAMLRRFSQRLFYLIVFIFIMTAPICPSTVLASPIHHATRQVGLEEPGPRRGEKYWTRAGILASRLRAPTGLPAPSVRYCSLDNAIFRQVPPRLGPHLPASAARAQRPYRYRPGVALPAGPESAWVTRPEASFASDVGQGNCA